MNPPMDNTHIYMLKTIRHMSDALKQYNGIYTNSHVTNILAKLDEALADESTDGAENTDVVVPNVAANSAIRGTDYSYRPIHDITYNLVHKLTDGEYMSIFTSCDHGVVIRNYIEVMYLNPDAPERQVVYVSDYNRKRLWIHNGTRWLLDTNQNWRHSIEMLIYWANISLIQWAKTKKSQWDTYLHRDGEQYRTNNAIRSYMRSRFPMEIYGKTMYNAVFDMLYDARILHTGRQM